MKDSAVLLIDCPDRKGLVARVSGLLYERGANILHADQHIDHDLGLFFMRVEWALDGFDLAAFREAFTPDRSRAQHDTGISPRAIARRVSRYSAHNICTAWPTFCTAGAPVNWPATFPIIVSNHREVEKLAAFYGVPFEHVPVTAETRR